jgi:hypothetical protein
MYIFCQALSKSLEDFARHKCILASSIDDQKFFHFNLSKKVTQVTIGNKTPMTSFAFWTNAAIVTLRDLSELKFLKYLRKKDSKKKGPNQVFKFLHHPILNMVEDFTLRYCIIND